MQKIRNISIYTILVLLLTTIIFPLGHLLGADLENPDAPNEVTDQSQQENTNLLELTSASGILIDQKTGNILYSHNIHDQLSPASVTKIMSMLLILEAIDSGQISLDDRVPVSENARSMGGSQIWLEETETLSVHEMLKAITVVSANEFAHRYHTAKL